MFPYYYPHLSARQTKQNQRTSRIASLPSLYHSPLSSADTLILSTPISTLVSNVQANVWDPLTILRAYGKQALLAHRSTHCLTEIMLEDAECLVKSPGFENKKKEGPLAGLPVSFKDTVNVRGYDSSIGYAAWVDRPVLEDGALVRLLRDAGAVVPYVKTAVPTTLLSFECASSVFGRTTNPYNPSYTPGGSTGGEAALLAFGGSRIGIGTDVAGSVRVPAHFCGIYSVRASTGRFPRSGNTTSVVGQEGVQAVYSPMAGTVEDLDWFWEKVVGMEPWKYDHSCLPIPWRKVVLPKVLKFGVMWDDEMVPPTPACKRALQETVRALQAHGHQVFTFNPPSPMEGYKIGSQLILADGGYNATSPLLPCEPNDPGVAHSLAWYRTPSFVRRIYVWYVRYIKRDAFYADMLELWTAKSVREVWKLTGEREGYRSRWHQAWRRAGGKGVPVGERGKEGGGEGGEGMDFLLCVPFATPAVKHGATERGVRACNWTFLFNVVRPSHPIPSHPIPSFPLIPLLLSTPTNLNDILKFQLDYTAGVLPITSVQPSLDALPPLLFSSLLQRLNAVARGIWEGYDAVGMEGLPVGVQVVGQRWEEEKVLKGMMEVERCVKALGGGFKGKVKGGLNAGREGEVME